jgi:lipoyl(octanoyl) transferase
MGMEFKTFPGLSDYQTLSDAMERHVAAIRVAQAGEAVWLLEHPPLYTGGTSAKKADLLKIDLPVFETGRGGQYTYHGPGQRIAYVMVDLASRGGDVRRFVRDLEEVIIRTLAAFGVTGERREGRIGIWVVTPSGEKKIAALGVRVTRGVTWHGLSLNVDPDLSRYNGIVPCGISEHGVTSLADLGLKKTVSEVDAVLIEKFKEAF